MSKPGDGDARERVTVQWLHTAPNPSLFLGGYDGGRKGWKGHAVRARDDETFEVVGRRVAACGMRPTHGWTIDVFIPVDDPNYLCARCLAFLVKDQRHDDHA